MHKKLRRFFVPKTRQCVRRQETKTAYEPPSPKIFDFNNRSVPQKTVSSRVYEATPQCSANEYTGAAHKLSNAVYCLLRLQIQLPQFRRQFRPHRFQRTVGIDGNKRNFTVQLLNGGVGFLHKNFIAFACHIRIQIRRAHFL